MLSHHLNHLKTKVNYVSVPSAHSLVAKDAIVAQNKNKFINRSQRSAIKIPRNLATIIAKDKDLLKPFSLYFQLKPLYYSGVIKDCRHHYPELCEYLGISINTLRQRISAIVRMDLAIWDGADLRLKSYDKVCKLYKLDRFYHKINNIGNMEDCLRVVAMKENFIKQEFKLNKKIIDEEIKQIIANGELEKLAAICKQKKIVSTPEMVKSFCGNVHTKSDPQKYFNASALRQWKKVIRLRMDVLLQKAQERTDNNLLFENKSNSLANPKITLSCRSVAKLYGCNTPSAGYYWEQIFKNLNLLNITGDVIEIKNHRHPKIYDRFVLGQNNGVFSKTTKKGKKYIFLRAANLLEINNHAQTPLFL